MNKEILRINNEVGSIQIITCPTCGFTFRAVDMNTRRKKILCPMCGSILFGLDFNKFIFIRKVR
ncbi:MAG: hypothetical protein ACFFAI_12055 [Promethearchaeota archaeon]